MTIVKRGIDVEMRQRGIEKQRELAQRKLEAEDYRGCIAELIELLQVKEALAIANRDYSLLEQQEASE